MDDSLLRLLKPLSLNTPLAKAAGLEATAPLTREEGTKKNDSLDSGSFTAETSGIQVGALKYLLNGQAVT